MVGREPSDKKRECFGGARAWSTGVFVGWFGLATWLGFGAAEFGLNVDGIGFGHQEYPTLMTALLLQGCVAVGGLTAVMVYRRTLPYLAAILVGAAMLFMTPLAIFATIGWHDERLCDRGVAPRTCQFLVETNSNPCKPDLDDECAGRAIRACRAGIEESCDVAIGYELMTHRETCEVFGQRCRASRRCKEARDPRACAEAEGLSHDFRWRKSFCESYKLRCVDRRSPELHDDENSR